jgi:hypothetical protein
MLNQSNESIQRTHAQTQRYRAAMCFRRQKQVCTLSLFRRVMMMQEAREFCSPSQSAKATRDHDPHKAHDPVGTLATIPSALNGRFSARGQLVCSSRAPKHAHTAATIHHVTGREGSHEMRQAVPHGRTHTDRHTLQRGCRGVSQTRWPASQPSACAATHLFHFSIVFRHDGRVSLAGANDGL